MRLQAVIDRFESDKAVLLLGEDETRCNFPRAYLPNGVSEGDYLVINISLDPDATNSAREETEDLLRRLLGNNQ
jgi:hypothetical protein